MRLCLIAFFMMLLPMVAVSQTARVAKWNILPLAHPDAKLLLGVDWRRVVESPLGPVILKQVQRGGHPLLGLLESIENVDRLLVSSPGSGTSPEGEQGRAPLLVVGEGRFALAKIRAMAKSDGALSRKYNDVELLVPPNATNADLHFALLDGQTILFGDGTSVKGAIDRWQKADAMHDRNPLFFRAVTLSTTQDIWAVVQDPSDSLSSLGINSSTLSEQVENLELGISVSQTLNASLTIKATSAEGAETLATGLPALLQLAALTYSHQPALTQLAKRLKVASESNFVKMGFSMDSKLIEQSINELRASATSREVPETSRLSVPGPGPLSSPAAAEAGLSIPIPMGPRVIRIVGMDEGIREIPYEPRKPQ